MAGLQKILKIHNIEMKNFDIFVETGLYDAKNFSSLFYNNFFSNIKKAYSVELNKQFVDDAYKNFPFLKNEKIEILHGDSGFMLEDIFKKNKDKKFIIWLDAHYSGGATSISTDFGECPLLKEIESIKFLEKKPTIIIDDLGCFLKGTLNYYNDYPSFDEVLTLSKKYFDFHCFLSERDEKNMLHYAILN